MAAMMVMIQPAMNLSSRRKLKPRRPSHRPTPAMAPTVAGVELQGRRRMGGEKGVAAQRLKLAVPAGHKWEGAVAFQGGPCSLRAQACTAWQQLPKQSLLPLSIRPAGPAGWLQS